jgi:hypothetical protein
MSTHKLLTVSRKEMIDALVADRFAGYLDCLAQDGHYTPFRHSIGRIREKFDAYCRNMTRIKKRYELRLGHLNLAQLEDVL